MKLGIFVLALGLTILFVSIMFTGYLALKQSNEPKYEKVDCYDRNYNKIIGLECESDVYSTQQGITILGIITGGSLTMLGIMSSTLDNMFGRSG